MAGNGSTFDEMLGYKTWARDKLLAAAVDLSDEQLDRPFEMGCGSLRATLHHLWSAERIWLCRWTGRDRGEFSEQLSHPRPDVAAMGGWFRATAEERNAYLAERRSAAALDSPISFVDRAGTPYTFPLRALLLHVCNHGIHHRAQAMHMLRRLEVPLPRPGLDYLFMKIEQAGAAPPALDLRTIRDLYEFADWAREQVHDAAAGLSDDQLDRPFPIGMGSLRKNLVHVRDGEQWWLNNWKGDSGAPFPATDETLSISDLRRSFDAVAAERNRQINVMSDADLQRIVEGRPRPDVVRRFPIGVTMLQLCSHGTHHRAQSLNMLRQLGAKPPPLDYVTMLNQPGRRGRRATQ